jgi:hypothetical protein
LRIGAVGYARAVGAVGAVIERLRRSELYDWLRLKGWIAFNVPRGVSLLGAGLLIGIAVAHVYVLTSQPALPTYFVVYAGLLGACCLLAAASLWVGRNPVVPQLGWFFGDLVSLVFVGLYLASRAAALPGLVAVTGRWDFAPGTFAGAFALGFLAVHATVLLGINVAYPQRQQWTD